ncbi:MAG: heme ABC transporter ATP-binding protein [Pseudomonadota bacterium]
MIYASHIRVARGGRNLLDDVSLSARAGEVLAILGPNGAGKSTLLKVMAGEFAPDAGEVALGGRRLRNWLPVELARVRAVMRQDTHLEFAFTAREVVMMGRYPHCERHTTARDWDIVDDALAAADAGHLAARPYPRLSGGEKARVQFARALAQVWPGDTEARLLFLDEPTAALDITHQHSLLVLARDLSRAHCFAVIAVLHDLNLAARYADRIALLDQGRVAALGTPAEVLTPEQLMATYHVAADCHTGPGGELWIHTRAAA